MTYRLGEVNLRNFKSHEDTRVKIPPGAVALLGENGAGKSSILEAIALALAVDKGRTRRLAQLVNERRGGAFTVTLRLDPVDGEAPSVEAIVEAGRGRSRYILKVGGKLVASGVEAYRREMNKILGLQYITDPSSFVERAVIVKQGGLQAIAEKMDKGKELREEIEAAIGIPDYREALKRLDNVWARSGSQEARLSEWHLKKVAKSLQEEKDRARKAKEGLAEARGRIAKLVGEAKRLEEKLEEILQEKARLEAKAREAAGLEAQLARIRGELQRLQAKKARLEKRLEEAKRARSEIPVLEALAGMAQLLDEVHKLQAEATSIRARVEMLEEAVRVLEEKERAKPAYEEYHRLEELRKAKLMEERAVQAKLAGVSARLDQARAALERSQRRLRQALDEASRLAGSRILGVEDLARVLEEVERRLAVVEEEERRARDRVAALKNRLGELQRIQEILEGGSASRCPVCGRELTEEHARELVERTRRQIAETARELEEARREAERLRRTVRELREARDRLARLLATARSIQEEAPSSEEVARLEGEAESLRRSLSGFRRELEELEERLRELEPMKDRYVWAVTQANRRKLTWSREEAERMLEEERRRLESLERAIEEAARRILEATAARSLEEAAGRIRKAQEELGRLREVAARLEEASEELDTVEEELGRARRELEELEERLEEARSAKARAERLEQEAQSVRITLERLKAEIDEARGTAARLEAEEREARERVAELERLWRLVRAGIAARNILARLQETLYKRSLLVLEEEMSRILDSFNLDPARVEIREEAGGPRVRVLTRSGGERSVSMLSGGERTSVALAYVLALNRMMGSRIGFLALDEPTSELDQERRQVLIDLVSRLTGPEGLVRQLIIVTHHEDVMDRVDTVCRVRKVGGVSRVECDGG